MKLDIILQIFFKTKTIYDLAPDFQSVLELLIG